MEALFLYLLKSSALIALFYLAYYLLLRKETFFKSNRWFLLFGLVTSAILPLVTFKKVVWIEAVPPVHYNFGNLSPMAVAAPVAHYEINWFLVFAAIYAIGIFIFFFKFVFDFNNLVKTLKGKTVTQQADFKFIDVNEKVSPFSYFNYIVYNSSLYSEADLDHILEHEKVHCEQNHSVDVLISRFFCILFWYNPLVWLYQKAILQNLEFIADSEALKNIADKKAYQITLLKVTTHDNCVAITNHFYQSLIKKRIIMLNKNQSKKWNSWKYALIIPVLIGFMVYFQVKVIAQERNNPDVISKVTAQSVTVIVDKNTSDEEMKQHAEMLKEKYGIKLKFSKVKRNNSGEITGIKAVYKDGSNKSGTYQVDGDEPIKPLRFFRNDSGAIGFGNQKEVRIIRNHGENADADDNNDDNQVVTIVSEDDEDAVAPIAPVAPVAPINGIAPIAPVAPLAPLAPMPKDKKVIIKKIKDKNGKISVTVNGETIDIDVDKIVNEAMASVDGADFDFNFNFDSDDVDDDVREAMKQAKIALGKARPQMEKARKRMAEQRMRSEDSREEMEDARQALEDSRRELEESRRQLEESRKEFEAQKVKMKSKKSK